MEEASKSLVKERIQFHRNSKRLLKEEIGNKKTELVEILGPESENIFESIENRYTKESNTCKDKQKKKLDKLKPIENKPNLPETQHKDAENKNCNVVNLSSRVLNDTETSVLSKGLNFSVVPKSVKALDFITGIESAVSQMSDEDGDRFRCEASLLLKIFPSQSLI